MEVRMGTFRIHHSNELMLFQHLGRAWQGEERGCPQRSAGLPDVPRSAPTPFRDHRPRAHCSQVPFIPLRGSASSDGSQEEGAG